jgi:pyrroloquinoline quinone biosynthesis protein B
MKTLLTTASLIFTVPVFASPALAQAVSQDPAQDDAARCQVELIVLGVSQDAGSPQLGRNTDPAWDDPSLRRRATSLAVIDRNTQSRYLFEATPDLREQLHHLDTAMPVEASPGLDGIFLTHAHIGHYTGLMFFGHESMGAHNVPVYALPSMAAFLFSNGPWDQLVRYENIDLQEMTADVTVDLEAVRVTAFEVPHRQEYTEVAGFRIDGPDRSALFLPDIDSWHEWDALGTRIEDMITSVDVAYLDATFFANGEIPGRDMSGFPHPFIAHSMERFANLSAEDKAKVHFIHFNHTNQVRYPDSPERAAVLEAGFNLAFEDERYCLGD